jgi:DNA-directed RNA polymerase subunit RPC12/RpoP
VDYRCPHCQRVFDPTDVAWKCPKCGHLDSHWAAYCNCGACGFNPDDTTLMACPHCSGDINVMSIFFKTG